MVEEKAEVRQWERILNILNYFREFGGTFGYFVEKNKSQVEKVLRKAFLDSGGYTDVEKKAIEARDAILKKNESVAETAAEKKFLGEKSRLVAIIADKAKTEEERAAAEADLRALPDGHKRAAASLEKKYQAIQAEFSKFSDDNKDIFEGLMKKREALMSTVVTIQVYKLRADKIPDVVPQNLSRELDLLIEA